MRTVRLGAFHFSIIHLRRKARPRVFPKHVPRFQNFSPGRELHNRIQPGIGDEEITFRSAGDMMHIVKAGKRDVAGALETGQFEHQYFCGCARVKRVADQS